MDGGDLSTVVGVASITIGTLATFCSSLFEECLKTYHRADLFEGLSDDQIESLENLLRREEEFFFSARIVRLVAYALTFFGALILSAHSISDFIWVDAVTGLGVMIGVALIGATLLPAMLSRHWAERVVLTLIRGYALLTVPFYPLYRLSEALSAGFGRVAGDGEEETPQQEFEDDIADSLDEAERDGLIGEGERRMIASIVDLREQTVKDIMMPRTHMICVNVADSVERAIEIANEHGHSRLPVYEDNRDNIVGVFYVRDALRHWKDRNDAVPPIKEIMRNAPLVPETQNLLSLLAEYRKNKRHMAIVLDEFGGTEGLATLEDLMEEIVGDIKDEFDANEESISPEDTETDLTKPFEVDARVKVAEFNREFGCELPESSDYTSVSGFLSAELGRIPAPGERFLLSGLEFEVRDATERMVRRVRITQIEAEAAAEDARRAS